MRVGIIGAGQIGGTLTRRLSALGHDVSVANSRGPETLAGLAAETGATAVPFSEAARNAEVVVVTIPVKNVPDLPAGLLDQASKGVVVIDTGNYYPRQRDGQIEAIEAGMPGRIALPVYGTDLDGDGVRRALSQATSERPSEFRASPNPKAGNGATARRR